MSSDDTANDTMRRYETDQDMGDTNADPQPAISPAPEENEPVKIDNTGNKATIPMAIPQSPVQTESDVAQTENSPEVKEDDAPEARSNRSGHPGDRAYHEV